MRDLLHETWVLFKRRLGFVLLIAAWLGLAFAPLLLLIGFFVTNPVLAIGSFVWIGAVILIGGCLMDARDIVKDRRG